MSHNINLSSHEVISAFNKIPEQILKDITKAVVLNEATSAKLIAEFGNTISKRVIRKPVTGDNIRCFFAVNLEGTEKLWETIASHLNIPITPMPAEVYERLEGLIDDAPFDKIFEEKIYLLNKDRLPLVS